MIAEEKLQGIYFRDIFEQPRALRDTVASLTVLPEIHVIREKLRSGELDRIILTGMGGSYQILHPLHIQLTQSGFNCIMVETSELLYSLPQLIHPRNVIVTVSQSGSSAEIVRLLEHKGPLYIGVTNTPSSPLSLHSSITLMTQAGEEGGVACKTAVSLLATLYWLGEHFTDGDLDQARKSLETAAPAVESYLENWQEHVESLVKSLAEIRHIFLAGRGSSLAITGLGAMVQKEAAHFHAEGMSSAALRHGPFEMLDARSFVVVFEGTEQVRSLNSRLVEDVRQTEAQAYLCGAGSPEGPFSLPAAHPAVTPILELLPAQMISLSLSYLEGREPGKFERITKVTTVE